MTDKKARPTISPEEIALMGEIQDAGEKMFSAYQQLTTLACGKYALIVKLSQDGFTSSDNGDGVFVDISNIVFHPAIAIKPAE